MVIAMSFLYDGFIDYLLFIVGYEDWDITVKDTCKIRKIVNVEKIINYIKLVIFGLGFNSRQPIMIRRCKDYTNKNRKLEVSAGHRPDGEET